MFCNACGSQLRDGVGFCPLCGKPVASAATTADSAPADTVVMRPVASPPMSAEATTPMPAIAVAPQRPAQSGATTAIIIVSVIVLILGVLGGGTFMLLRSGILGGTSTLTKVDKGVAAGVGKKLVGKDTTPVVGISGGDVAPAGEAVDITPGAANLSVSSTLKGYPASQLVDGKLDTCWAEDVSGYGEGESISIDLGEMMWLSEVQIVPGYLKEDAKKGVDRWYSNGRMTRAKLVFSDGSESATFELNPDKKDFQSMVLDPAVKTGSVEIVILGTAPASTGTTFDAEDTSASELKLFGFGLSL